MTIVLGIETSCDETASAVVENGDKVLSNVVSSQVALHEPFGGVVPEIASRAHAEIITSIIEKALLDANLEMSDVHAVAVTSTPGLIGSLLVGVAAAKALAAAHDLPLVAVDHVKAHLYSPRLSQNRPGYPHVGLVASGGHTALYLCRSEIESELLGRTHDDAAGEAFDKVSSVLGLGYPGGPAISRAAEKGDRGATRFPRAMMRKDSLDFSFSGLKTAVLYHVKGQDASGEKPFSEELVPDVAASFQEAVVDVLVKKIIRAADKTAVKEAAISGGVSANRRLREKLKQAGKKNCLEVYFPEMEYTGDNAAMIAGLGFHLLRAGVTADLALEASP